MFPPDECNLGPPVGGKGENIKNGGTFELTDLGNAERFKAQHGKRVAFISPLKAWHLWDGTRWKRADSGEVHRLAHDTARSILGEAERATDPKQSITLARWAAQSQSSHRLDAIVKVASDLLSIEPLRFDADPWLFNVLNGTIDLRTGALLPHRREDYITKLAPVAYDPEASHEVLERVLDEAIPDEGICHFMQKAFGYALTGLTDEEVMFFVYGPEATGKSTLLEAVKNVMGDYAKTCDAETFLRASHVAPGGARSDLARLAGVRMVLASELDEGRRLAASNFKRLVGGDTVTARKLYGEEFEYRPQCKLFLMANHFPQVDADDGAMWRRIRVLPFEHIVPEVYRDPNVKRVMLEECGPALLAWIVVGCLLWRAEGLIAPPSVKNATKKYRDEMNDWQHFVDDCCEVDRYESVGSNTLMETINDWARRTGSGLRMNSKQLADRLRRMGCRKEHVSSGTIWYGIGLRDDAE